MDASAGAGSVAETGGAVACFRILRYTCQETQGRFSSLTGKATLRDVTPILNLGTQGGACRHDKKSRCIEPR